MTRTAPPTPLHIVSRIAAAVAGGWAFVYGFAALGIALLVAAGQPYEQARTAVMLLAFIVFLSVICWSIAAASLLRVWAVLAAGAALMSGGAWLLQRTLV